MAVHFPWNPEVPAGSAKVVAAFVAEGLLEASVGPQRKQPSASGFVSSCDRLPQMVRLCSCRFDPGTLQ